jgi:SAM-dependent methyltransferase
MRPCPRCSGRDYQRKYLVDLLEVVRCTKCGLVYLINPPQDSALYETYHARSLGNPEDYCESSQNERIGELFWINQQRIRVIEQLKPQGRLLDIGCGQGFFLKTAQDHGYTAHGIDVSEIAVTHAKTAFGVSASVSSLDALNPDREGYDIICAWHVLEHFLDPVEALRKMRSLLPEDGVCVLEVPNLHSLKFIVSRTKWHGGNHPLYHRTFFTWTTLHGVLSEAGFSAVRRIALSYRVPGRSVAFQAAKKALNMTAIDSFLAAVAWK